MENSSDSTDLAESIKNGQIVDNVLSSHTAQIDLSDKSRKFVDLMLVQMNSKVKGQVFDSTKFKDSIDYLSHSLNVFIGHYSQKKIR